MEEPGGMGLLEKSNTFKKQLKNFWLLDFWKLLQVDFDLFNSSASLTFSMFSKDPSDFSNEAEFLENLNKKFSLEIKPNNEFSLSESFLNCR